jgi:threonine/homoserine/homoserine lactone efflux protein
MFDFETLLLFIMASSLLALAPGPDNLFVLTQSMSQSSKAGIFITLGLCTGLIFHTTAVALGVAVIFKTSIIAFNLLKFAGAIYLLYLAYMSFKSNSHSRLESKNSNIPLFKLYKRGIIMNITNPKVSIFFLAFLPQFTNPQNANVTLQIFILGAVFMVCALVVFSAIAVLAGYVANWFKKSSKAQNILNKIAGTVFAGLAIKLVLSER